MKVGSILVTGSKGLLGSYLVDMLEKRGYLVDPVDVDILDITDKEAVFKYVNSVERLAVINCAAFTDVEACEEDKYDLAKKVNGDAPGYIAEACLEAECNLIHISTDYVDKNNQIEGFDEFKSGLSPMNRYGETKLKGEKEVEKKMKKLRDDRRWYIVRTQWLFGPSAKNFISKITKFGKEMEELKVVDDEIGCPTYVKDLSESIIYLLERSPESGIYHVSSSDHCSRYEFAKAILEKQGIKTPIKRSKLADWNRKAYIAKYSILRNTKLPKHRKWEDMLDDFLEEHRL